MRYKFSVLRERDRPGIQAVLSWVANSFGLLLVFSSPAHLKAKIVILRLLVPEVTVLIDGMACTPQTYLCIQMNGA